MPLIDVFGDGDVEGWSLVEPGCRLSALATYCEPDGETLDRWAKALEEWTHVKEEIEDAIQAYDRQTRRLDYPHVRP